ncbi:MULTISPECIES: GNAT family N-acetyltransferase [unclassified Acinetobacter]|uniref:GNAT family N-acetyltransferase n=1 Tax=unclassified Acinetobacter TaxID=196816 RepID=UPI0025773BF5|nr:MULTISPECIES: GNAT family N-acetyltransferase [unclassified Acinetobacter]MDM1763031.1 GNAT family N-acetyltransferase [Acinetobacter sp. 226-1]MDM1766510.1 GNAT family N-acetyltransferase [Acinetobacter sp. 226-4]
MTAQIIPLEEINFEQWLPLWQGYLNFYKSQLTDEQIRLSWKRITNPEQADMFGYAIQIEGQVAGFVHLISHMSMWTDLPYCYLQDLYVNEQFRNQGLARQLIEHSYSVCAGKFDRIYWLTQESNITAQYLYDRIANKTGFIQYKKAL